MGRAKVEAQVRWDDLRVDPGAWSFPGFADPTRSTWQPGGSGATLTLYKFNNNDYVSFTVQMPHRYKVGTDLKPHVHWTPHDRGIIESGSTVQWEIDYSIADIMGTFPTTTTIDLTSTNTMGTDDTHIVTASGTIDGTGLNISHMIVGRLYRGPTDTWSGTGNNAPGLLELDFHYEVDDRGSQTEVLK